MKRGGRVIYGGKLGEMSQIMIKYFQGIDGISPISEGYNPATSMLEISTPAAEERIGQDFAEIYRNSQQLRGVEDCIKLSSTPPPNSEPLKFDTTYSQNSLCQFKYCLWKQNLVYWRSPAYNVVRLFFTTISGLITGSVFWSRLNTKLNVVLGTLFSSCTFIGVSNASAVQRVVSIRRKVFYRERAAGMYSPLPYAAAQGLIEIPYIAAQTIVFGIITYLMMDCERVIGKFLLYLLFMFLTFTYYTMYGMMAVGLTPTQPLAAVISSAAYSLWNLLAGFLIPKPRITGWWIWFYYINPVAWTLRGAITSQLGDVKDFIVGPEFKGTVKGFLDQHFGYGPGMIGVSAASSSQFPEEINKYDNNTSYGVNFFSRDHFE